MKNLEGGFTLVALMDGTTVNGMLRIEGLPLVQRYNKGTDHFIPDFVAAARNEKPTAVVVLRDSATGLVLVPETYNWYYNGIQLTFDPSTHMCSNKDMVGMFELIENHSTNIGGVTYALPALRVWSNLVPISGLDNDRISIGGTVKVNNRAIQFEEIGKEVVIQEATGNAYDVVITDDKGGALTQEGETLTAKATLYKDGVEVVDYSGFSFDWVKLSDIEEDFGNSRTVAVTTADIDNVLMLQCNIYEGPTLVGSGFTQLTDFTDPFYVDFEISGTGVVGNALRPGQSAIVKPVARRRKNGTVNTAFSNWKWNIKDNSGRDFAVKIKGTANFTAASVEITSIDLQNAGGGIVGSVSSTI